LLGQGRAAQGLTIHIFMTHLHWDHLQGFPFFAPAFIPGNKIIIHSYHDAVESAFRQQMQPPCFPVPMSVCAAEIQFDVQPPQTPYAIEGFQITSFTQKHPGVAYGYRFEKAGKSVVFSTDSEHKNDAHDPDYPYIDFIRGADLLIFDAQYSMADATFTKADWGHSSNVMGVELASRARVKRLALCHHEHTSTDERLEEFLKNTCLYRDIHHQEAGGSLGQEGFPQEVLLAYDGLEVTC
jgi:phosphoribosyl 1,2-cyclic phosphodiesterase